MSDYDLVPIGERASFAAYVRLFERAYGPNDKLTERYLRWLYDENPHGRAVGVDAWRGDELAAHYVTIPRRYRIDGQVVDLLLAVNIATDPDHQRRGLFKRTALAAFARGADLGYQFVIGVANAQAIHGYQTSLGFETLGQVRLAVGRKPPVFDVDAPHIVADRSWLGWRLTNPSAAYFLTDAGRGDVVVNARRGKAVISIGRAPAAAVSGIAGLPHKSWRGPLPLTPVYPAAGNGPFVPARLLPSPWHVILRTLAAPSTKPMRNLQFDGLSMDSF